MGDLEEKTNSNNYLYDYLQHNQSTSELIN